MVALGLAMFFLFLSRQIAPNLLPEALLHFLDMLPLFRRKVGREPALLSGERTLLGVPLELLPPELLELFHPDHLALPRRELLPKGFAPTTLEFPLVASGIELLPFALVRRTTCRATLPLLL
jgi:hypothetical protein